MVVPVLSSISMVTGLKPHGVSFKCIVPKKCPNNASLPCTLPHFNLHILELRTDNSQCDPCVVKLKKK